MRADCICHGNTVEVIADGQICRTVARTDEFHLLCLLWLDWGRAEQEAKSDKYWAAVVESLRKLFQALRYVRLRTLHQCVLSLAADVFIFDTCQDFQSL